MIKRLPWILIIFGAPWVLAGVVAFSEPNAWYLLPVAFNAVFAEILAIIKLIFSYD